jgi:hypothetical protein
VSPRDRLVWIQDFILIDADLPAEIALEEIQRSRAPWVVISRHAGSYLYAFTIDELWKWPALRNAWDRGANLSADPFGAVLDLHEEFQSTPAVSRVDVPAIDLTWRPQASAPSVARYIHVDPDRKPRSIGYMAVREPRRTRGIPRSLESPSARASEPLPPPPRAAAAPQPEPVLEDEGTTPVRYPRIEADRTLEPGQPVVITVDLQQTADSNTDGGAADLGVQPDDWTELKVSVVVSCPLIEPDAEDRGVVTVHRNAASTPATISGRVLATAKAGDEAPVTASFFEGTRFCGSALRTFRIGATADAPARAGADAGSRTRGTIVPQPAAAQPDVTVRVSTDIPNEMTWLVETARFDGLPPKLRERVTLKNGVDREVSDLFQAFATLKPGEHVATFEGFGTQLWNRVPRMFRDVYWALWDHYQRPLTFQFITNEPNLPWELMRPVREDESEIHPPLALKHPVARWLEDFDGYMRNQVPPGGVFTIAPNYKTVSRQLPRAQTESAMLIQHFAAQSIPGTRAAVTKLLETLPPDAPVALLHFAGHGQFMRTATTESSIKLEDGALTASEVGRPEVKLGKACRTLVFLNACDTGAVGTIFGEVGGWAAAFLSRQFGGFIAPLWSVEDDDAAIVADELLKGIITEQQPIGEVLRALRAKHGSTSPTFYSYLYYGDVTASLAR